MIALLMALAVVLMADAVAADMPDLRADLRPDLRVGFDGVYRTGSWTPLTIEFPASPENAPPAVCVWVEDPDGQYVRSIAAPVEIGADGRRAARLTVRFGRPSGRVLVEAVRGADGDDASGLGRRAATPQSLPTPISATDTIMLVLGDLPAAERASRLLAQDDGSRPRVVAINARSNAAGAGEGWALGRTARDFDGADSIVVCGRAVAAIDPTTLRGVDDWVRPDGCRGRSRSWCRCGAAMPSKRMHDPAVRSTKVR